MKDLSNLPQKTNEEAENVPFSMSTSLGFTQIQRAGQLLAGSTLVPATYRGNLSNCVVALEMATRMKASVLMVMQNLYLVHGNPGWSAQFLIASFNMDPNFSALHYKFQGEEGKPSWGCLAYATEYATGETLEGSLVTLDMARKEGWSTKSGSKWATMPEQMLRYRAAAFFVRTFAPQITMGLQTAEELTDTFEARQDANGVYTVVNNVEDTNNNLLNSEEGDIEQNQAKPEKKGQGKAGKKTSSEGKKERKRTTKEEEKEPVEEGQVDKEADTSKDQGNNEPTTGTDQEEDQGTKTKTGDSSKIEGPSSLSEEKVFIHDFIMKNKALFDSLKLEAWEGLTPEEQREARQKVLSLLMSNGHSSKEAEEFTGKHIPQWNNDDLLTLLEMGQYQKTED